MLSEAQQKAMLSERQRALLAHLSDGALHNLFAYPLIENQDSPFEALRMIWDAGWLEAQGLVAHQEEDDEAVWFWITEAGRKMLGQYHEND